YVSTTSRSYRHLLQAYRRRHPSRIASVLPRPPPSSLSPYTTLFRSHDFCLFSCCFINRTFSVTNTASILPTLIIGQHSRPFTSLDRKSTRLNSSHVSISYAVFCLTKKTPVQVQITPVPRTSHARDPG